MALRVIGALLMLGAFAACAPTVRDIARQAQKADPELSGGFGPMADSPLAIDADVAAIYVRLSLYRRRAAAYLENGLIEVRRASHAQAIAEHLRRDLDQAVVDDDKTKIGQISRLLEGEIKTLEQQ